MNKRQEERESKRALVSGTILNEKYRIEGILGEGGFGITYEGKQLDNGGKVTIKEYFPYGVASRDYADSDQNLHIFHGEKEQYLRGKRRFLNEAEILREYQYLQGIVTVQEYFECNQTAYIVMEYIEGITLKQYVRENGCLSYQELLQLLEPVMKSLVQIHRKGVIHRDISPSNLLIGLDNQARLIDFGAADLVEERYKKSNNTVILKNGYAPPEQYISEGKQGPWTDVYAMASMFYMALTGQTPIESVARLQGKILYPELTEVEGLEDWQAHAILVGMELKISKRYKNMEEFLEALTSCPSREDERTEYHSDISSEVKKQVKRLNKERRILYVICGVLIVLIILGMTLMNPWRKAQEAAQQKPETEYLASEDMMSEKVESEFRDTENVKTQLCTMPHVIGMKESVARQKIQKADDKIAIIVMEEHSNEIKKGVVISQDVASDTKYNQGMIQEVVLTISAGREDESESENEPAAAKQDGAGTGVKNGTSDKSGNSNSGTSTGTNSNSNTNTGTGTNSGSNVNAGTGTDGGSNTNAGTGTNSGSNTNAGTGTNGGSNTNAGTGTNSGSNVNAGTDVNSGSNTDAGIGQNTSGSKGQNTVGGTSSTSNNSTKKEEEEYTEMTLDDGYSEIELW